MQVNPLLTRCGAHPGCRTVVEFVAMRTICLLLLGASLTAQADSAGGILELPLTAQARPRPTAAQIQAYLPARGAFNFPAPYNTRGVRLTNAGDCGGQDCVYSVGYSYWRNINNHTGTDTLYAFIGLNRSKGGAGPTLFSYNKVTEETLNLGPLFAANSPFSTKSGEGWYFSGTQPTRLYVNDGARMLRYDVISKQFETVFDVRPWYGADKLIWQMHSSDDDRVHSATLMAGQQVLGCVVYHEDSAQFQYFPKIGSFDECHVDKGGRWLMSLEDIDGRYDKEMRIFDLATGAERRVWDQEGAVAHADMGYGYVVGADNWSYLANAESVWDFSNALLSGRLVSQTIRWDAAAPNHLSHTNARPGVPIGDQYACGSGASAASVPWANEVICFLLDGSLNVLVAAPVMTDMSAASGGDAYNKQPKGNLDVTGQYFIWTSNTGGSRVDAFMVRLPAQLLTDGCPADPLSALLGLAGVRVIPSTGSATVSWITGVLGDSRVEYGPTPDYGSTAPADPGLLLAHSVTLDGLVPGTLYHYRVQSQDILGNLAASADCQFMTVPAGTPPVPPPGGAPPGGAGSGGGGSMPALLGLFALASWRRRKT